MSNKKTEPIIFGVAEDKMKEIIEITDSLAKPMVEYSEDVNQMRMELLDKMTRLATQLQKILKPYQEQL